MLVTDQAQLRSNNFNIKMRQLLIFLVAVSFAGYSIGKRIELLRFNQASTLPQGNFIPVYSAIKDFPHIAKEKEPGLVLLKRLNSLPSKNMELRNLNPEPEEDIHYDSQDTTGDSEARNFQAQPIQALPDLQNFQTLPNFHMPELTNFPLHMIPNTESFKKLHPQANEATSSGRTFKHFLLMKGLLGNGGNGCNSCGGGGYGGGHGSDDFNRIMVPLFINTPVNVTNVNNNTLTNTPAAAAAAAAADDPNAGFRINYIGIPQTQQFPVQMPLQSFQMPQTQNYQQPTPVYHQRQAVASAQPTYAVAMLNIPGTSSYMPLTMQPQYHQSMVSRNSADAQRRHTLNAWSNASKNQSPWSTFTNNLRGLQFL